MKKRTLSLLAAFLFVAPSVKAEIDGGTLLESCNEAARYMDQNRSGAVINLPAANLCVGYISGVNDLHAVFVRSVSCFDPPVYCRQQPDNIEQLVQTVVNYLQTHAADLHLPGSLLALAAFKEAFPCTFKTSKK